MLVEDLQELIDLGFVGYRFVNGQQIFFLTEKGKKIVKGNKMTRVFAVELVETVLDFAEQNPRVFENNLKNYFFEELVDVVEKMLVREYDTKAINKK